MTASAEVIPFEFEKNQVRTIVGEDGEPWFVAKDVAQVLGYKNKRHAISTHCRGVAIHDIPTKSGTQSMQIIPERDVYRLIMRSNLPEAERFEEWVVGEVLPSIRKTGGYSLNQTQQPNVPESIYDLVIESAKAMKDLDRRVENNEERLNSLESQFSGEYMAIKAFSSYNGVSVDKGIAQRLGFRAKRLSVEQGKPTGKVFDQKWGSVNTYEWDVLVEVFREFGLL